MFWMECGMGRNCQSGTCIIRKAFYRSCQKAPMVLSKWLDLQTHLSFLDLHHFLLPLLPAPILVLPSSANGKPSTQMPLKILPMYRNRELRNHDPAAQTQLRLYSPMPSAHHLLRPGTRPQKLPHCRWQADFRHIAHT